MENYQSIIKAIKKSEGSLKTIGVHPSIKKFWDKINSFEGLETIDELERLDISDVNISSFAFCQPQPNLIKFNCNNTPLAKLKYLDLMAVIIFGDSLEYVNRKRVLPNTKETAKLVRKGIIEYLKNNWVVVQSNPIRLLNLETRQRKAFYINNEKVQDIVNQKKLGDEQVQGDATEPQNLEETQKNKNDDNKSIQSVAKNSTYSIAKRAKPEAVPDEECRKNFRETLLKVITNREFNRENVSWTVAKRYKAKTERQERAAVTNKQPALQASSNPKKKPKKQILPPSSDDSDFQDDQINDYDDQNDDYDDGAQGSDEENIPIKKSKKQQKAKDNSPPKRKSKKVIFSEDEDDEGDDEDYPPKKAPKKMNFDDDDEDEDDEDYSPKRAPKKMTFSDDDEGDDEDYPPKRAPKKMNFDDEDEDDEDYPPKRAPKKMKFSDDDDEGDEIPVRKGKSSKKIIEDDDDDEDE